MALIALHNLGCSKNQIDGERIIHLLKNAGNSLTDDFDKAEIIVVNTCAFIREAQEEAIEAILEAASFKKGGRCRRLIVSGCFSERYRDEVKKKFPEVDLWVGVHDWEKLLAGELDSPPPSRFKRELSAPIATQYLKIAEGCSHGCTYCAIPLIRGVFKSRPEHDIIEEAQWLESRGVRELILVAQDSSFYGRDIGGSLDRLLAKLLDATEFPWIRVMYLHPNHVSGELLRLFATKPRLCPYFDMPLQHIADPILKAMNRRPLSGPTRDLIKKIRETVPNVALRSTFILGFPGETEAHFEELFRFVEETRFDKLGVFPYSPEEGTRAVSLHPRPRTTTAQRRCDAVMALQREISRELLSVKISSTVEVIVDGPSDDREFPFVGRTRADAPEIDGKVYLSGPRLKEGMFAKVKVIKAGDYDLFGKVIS
jgi:ribosomal protein S12 methylthiotransferase